ncbi:hypothetical protein R1sor_025121 [Riccia sorocarpa]|uniref:J domain-containing protein n=1 Tax=Riccia sorocarpa TaxID=122646 RepID=A0ABD3G874_9MARC
MENVHDYYTKLYQREEVTNDVLDTRRVAFATLSKRIHPDQDRRVSEVPTEEEVERIAKLLKNDRSPGLDGLTTETLMCCWSFVRHDCLAMVLHFWDTGTSRKSSREQMRTGAGLHTKDELKDLATAMRVTKIRNLSQLRPYWDSPNTLLTAFLELGSQMSDRLTNATHKLHSVIPIAPTDNDNWAEADGWSWGDDTAMGSEAWNQPTAKWGQLLYSCKDNDHIKLNDRWDSRDGLLDWKERWSQLWDGAANTRTKIRIWRYLRQGYFTNVKAKDWGIGDGSCSRCQLETETFLHAEMIHWDQDSAYEDGERSARERRSPRRQRRIRRRIDVRATLPPLDEETRMELWRSLQQMIQVWGREDSPSHTTECSHVTDSEWVTYTSPDRLMFDILDRNVDTVEDRNPQRPSFEEGDWYICTHVNGSTI